MIFAYITGNETAKHAGGTINTIGMVEDASITPTDRDALEDNGYTGWKFQVSVHRVVHHSVALRRTDTASLPNPVQ